MPRHLPARPNLEHLRKQAKALLDERRTEHPDWTLSDAQHALAQAYGFESWPKLKAHVDALAVRASPFAGTWRADLSRSTRHPANLFRSATLELSVSGDAVTIVHDAVDEAGRPDRGANTLQCDGLERTYEHGYRMTARWRGPHVIEVLSAQAGLEPHLATYEASSDACTLTVTTRQQALVMPPRADLLPGTLDLLILKAVSLGPCTGTAYCCASSRSRAVRCSFSRARSIRRCTGSSSRG
jgi:hypothetical protein